MKGSSKFILGIVATLIVLGAAGGAYYYGSLQRSTTSTTPTPTSVPQETSASTSTPTIEPTAQPRISSNRSAVIENVKASVESRNYAALESYMAGSVSVILYATECCGVLSPQKATEQMSYLNNGTAPWDFSLTSTIAQKLITADPANFAGRIIGIAANGMVVSFNLNNGNKIDKIFISADYKLIIP